MKISNIAGILLLLFGVGAGVFLVQNVQDYREKAAGPTKQKLCHKTGSADNPYVSIEVDEHALKAHIDHGDTLGECPDDGNNNSDSSDGGTSNDSTSQNSSNNDNSGESGSESGESEGVQVVTETRYVYLNPGTLEFYIKFLGVDEKREDKSIRLELRKQDEEVHIYEDVEVAANTNGVYGGTLQEVPAGQYDIFIKSVNHLQEEFEGVNIQRGFNRWYWNERELIPGDMDADNDVDLEDIAIFLSYYTQEEVDVDAETTYYDVNFDGKINQEDINLILENFDRLVIEGKN